jgi:hypothetical protein
MFLCRVLYPMYLQPRSTGFGLVAEGEGRVVGYTVEAIDDARFHRLLALRRPGVAL